MSLSFAFECEMKDLRKNLSLIQPAAVTNVVQASPTQQRARTVSVGAATQQEIHVYNVEYK